MDIVEDGRHESFVGYPTRPAISILPECLPVLRTCRFGEISLNLQDANLGVGTERCASASLETKNHCPIAHISGTRARYTLPTLVCVPMGRT